MKNCFLKIRVDDALDKTLREEADKQGVTLSDLVRALLRRAGAALSQEQFLEKIDARLATMPQASAPENPAASLEPLLVEVLLLTRELAAERQAQALGRVGHQLNTLYPTRKKI